MKILLTGPLPPHPGGGAISRAQLAVGFARAGHQVCCVSPITHEAARDGDSFAEAHPELQVARYLLRNFDPAPFVPPAEAFLREEKEQVQSLVAALLRNFSPDLVVVGRETFARYVPQLALAAGVPSVLLVRGSPTGHILNHRFPERDAEQLLAEFRKVDRIIAVAKHLAQGLRALGFDNVAHIPNAIDTAQFVRRPKDPKWLQALALDTEATLVLVPANLHDRKRPEDVVNSARIALRERPDLVYLIAGTGVLREKLERLCDEDGLKRRFRFLGWKAYDDMPALMNLADLVVMASEAEGMSRAYIEAMASERLLLASDIPSAREIVQDGVNGLLFRMGDVEHLAARTVEAAANPALRDRLGRQARSTVHEMSVGQVVPRYLQVFADTIAAARHSRHQHGSGV